MSHFFRSAFTFALTIMAIFAVQGVGILLLNWCAPGWVAREFFLFALGCLAVSMPVMASIIAGSMYCEFSDQSYSPQGRKSGYRMLPFFQVSFFVLIWLSVDVYILSAETEPLQMVPTLAALVVGPFLFIALFFTFDVFQFLKYRSSLDRGSEIQKEKKVFILKLVK